MKANSYESPHAGNGDPIAALHERGGLILGTHLYEPMTGRKKVYKPYEPAPLVTTDDIATHQMAVLEMHHNLIQNELVNRVSPKVLEYVFRNIETRMTQRDGTNAANYGRRLYETPLAHPKIQADGHQPTEMAVTLLTRLQQACEQGTISMQLNCFISELLGRGEAELANLTTVGDKRVEYKEPMYEEISELVGHDVRGIEPYRIKVEDFDRKADGKHANHLGAMRVKLKRHLGYATDGTEIKQRTFAIIDMSQKSGMDQTIVEAIFVAYETQQHAKRQNALARAGMKLTAGHDEEVILSTLRGENAAVLSMDDTCDYAAIPEVNRMLQELIARDMCDPLVLACNETIYSTDKKVSERQRLIGLLPS